VLDGGPVDWGRLLRYTRVTPKSAVHKYWCSAGRT
jgi:hypothetical protein